MKLLLYIAVVLGLPVGLFGQSGVSFQRIDSRSGLSHNTVFAVTQDHEGYIWIGTSDGLNRYDGYSFVVYRHDAADSTSLSDNSIQVLFEDTAGTLWIGTANGLNRLDRDRNRFIRVAPVSLEADDRQNILQIVQDGDGTIWLRTNANRLFHRPAHQEHFTAFNLNNRDPDSTSALTVGSVGAQAHSPPWITTWSDSRLALHRYDIDRNRFDVIAELPAPDRLSPMYLGTENRIWIGGAGPAGFQVESHAIHPIAPWPQDLKVTVFVEDRNGLLWLGTEDGLFRYDPASGTMERFTLDETGTAALSNFILNLFEDQSGAVWIGTRSGLYRYDPHIKPFRHIRPGNGLPEQPSSGIIMAIDEGSSGQLHVGTLGGGLYELSDVFDQGAVVDHRSYQLPDDQVWAVHTDRSGRKWVGTEAGLCSIPSGQVTCVPVDLPPATPETVPVVYALAEARPGLWTVGQHSVYRIDPDTRQWTQHLSLIDSLGFGLTTIQAVHTGRASGTLWIGTENRGLVYYTPSSGRLHQFPLVVQQKTGLIGKTIYTIHEDADGLLWIGTSLGLVRLDPTRLQDRSDAGAVDPSIFRTYYDPESWPGTIIYSILEDAIGRLWLGTNKGLVRFDPKQETFRHFDAGDGIGNTEFNRRSVLQTRAGHFVFGGLNGLTVFDPLQIQDNPYVPPIVVTRFQKSNRSGTTTLYPPADQPLRLSYRDYSFLIEFAALSFTNPEKNRYRYRLEGFDPVWSRAGPERTVRYTNIPPATYRFQVQGANNDGLWNEIGTSLTLIISPPFYQTWWFRFLVAITVLGLLAAAYRYRVQRLLEMERMRLRIAGDLHDDVGSKLSGIALMSELLESESDLPENRRTELQEISNSAREIIDDLRDIVWFIDPDHDRAEKTVEKMHQVARSLLNGTTYSIETKDLGSLEQADMTFRRNLFLIYKEALHNITRHADAQHVSIRLDEHRGRLHLSISDDGLGFDPAVESDGNGLKNMQRRAEQMGGTLTLNSTQGQGTTIELRV